MGMATGPVAVGDALKETDDTVDAEDPVVEFETEEELPDWTLRV